MDFVASNIAHPLFVSGSFGSGTPKEVLSALFGVSVFDGPLITTAGPEKRLEFDLRKSRPDAVLNANLVHEVAALLHLAPQAASIAHPTAGEGFALLCDGAIILTMPQCVIIICDMDVAVHRAVPALKTLIASHGFAIEWASFKRKNNGCPWGAKKDSSNVEEYAILKETFPAGNSFMFGAIDSDHYFDFIFDDLQRPTNESDVQCNIKLYGVEFDENFPKHVGSHLVTAGEPGRTQQAVIFSEAMYETLRVKSTEANGLTISYETNAEACDRLPLLAAQIVALMPSRFTITVLSDCNSRTNAVAKEGHDLSLDPALFPGYCRENRTTNTFQHGYVMTKVSYKVLT
jgi:S-adenosylmethionine decarboxylase